MQLLDRHMSHWVRVIIDDATAANTRLPEHIMSGLKRIAKIVEVSDVVQFRTDELATIADDISMCTDLTELSNLLWQATTGSGFQNFSLFVLSQGRSATFPSRFCTSLSDEWLGQYFSKSYQYIDPVVNRASQEDGDFLFSELTYSFPMVEEFWKDAEKHKVGRNGFCRASTRPDGARLAVAFMTSANAHMTRENTRLNAYDLAAIAELAIECFCCLSSGYVAYEDELTVQELRFLHMIATSQNPEAALLQLPCYGSNKSLQNSIRKKLGVKTIFQAVSVASSTRLFDDLPYYKDEVISPFPKLAGWGFDGQSD